MKENTFTQSDSHYLNNYESSKQNTTLVYRFSFKCIAFIIPKPMNNANDRPPNDNASKPIDQSSHRRRIFCTIGHIYRINQRRKPPSIWFRPSLIKIDSTTPPPARGHWSKFSVVVRYRFFFIRNLLPPSSTVCQSQIRTIDRPSECHTLSLNRLLFVIGGAYITLYQRSAGRR